MALPAGALPPRTRVFRFGPGVCEELELGPPENARELVREGMVTWIDVQGLGDEDMLLALGRAFEIHPLALADVTNTPQRPKAEDYHNHIVFMTRMVRPRSSTEVDVEQVSIFAGAGYVLSFQEHYGDVLDPVRARLRDGNGPMRTAGSGYLAYAILDTIIDGYYPVIELVSERIERLEDRVLDRPTPRVLDRINHAKRDLSMLRRGIWPQLEALNRLAREGSDFLPDEVELYLRDTTDHCAQLLDVIDSHRELVSGLMNTYLSVVSNRTNEVMKVLTIMATIFIPLTFLAGVYGMNFQYMPELHRRWGYPVVMAGMALTAIAMLVFFRRRGWLGNGGDEDDEDGDEERKGGQEQPPGRSN